jgi:cell division protein FtsL
VIMKSVLAKAVVIVLPVVSAALFYVWAEITTVRIGYLLSHASDSHRALLEVNRGLRIEVAALRAPERLEKLAIERFNLEPPRTEQVIRLEGSEALVRK